MRILLDEQLPVDLAALFEDAHQPVHVLNYGWVRLKNGELLRKAEKEFDAFLTMDTNLRYQQNLQNVRMTIVVIRAISNRYEDLVPLVPAIRRALHHIREGEVVEVSSF